LCLGPDFHQILTKRSPNMMANWVFASAHSRGGIFHSRTTWRKTLAQDQEDELRRRLVAGEMAPRSHRAPEFGVQGLDRVGGVDDFADRRSEGEERDDLLPLPPPDLANCRIFSAPWAVLEGLQGVAAGLGVCGAVDFAQLGDDGLPVFPGRKIQRVADQMNDGVVEEARFFD
jgi:hypothetical protein